MTTYTIDTHETVRQLTAAGVPDTQAEAIVTALSRSDADIVTKTDLRQEIAAAKAELRQEIAAAKAELRQEIAVVRADLEVFRSEVKAGQAETQAKIAAAINKILFAQIAVAGLLFAGIRLF